MSMERIRDWLQENRITEVECLVPDMIGNVRGKFIPADKFIKEDSRLPESILVQTVTGGYTQIHESGRAQMEINFLHGDALSLADQVFVFKRTMRETAHRHGIYAGCQTVIRRRAG